MLVGQKLSKLKTLVLKLKLRGRQPDLTSLNSEQLDHFVDGTVGELQDSLIKNISDLRERIKRARSNPSNSNYDKRMTLYQELLNSMLPVIQGIRNITGEILTELQALINQVWNDICKNDGRGVDRLLDEHMYRTESHIHRTFSHSLGIIEAKIDTIQTM